MAQLLNAAQSHRVVVARRGGPEVLSYQSVDMPQPAAGEARVRVEAAGVSAYDVMLRGKRFPGFPRVPYSPGEDFVGIVDAVGEGVCADRLGERVGAWTFGDAGAYADHICRPAKELVPVPDGLKPELAAATIVNGLTAELALHQAVQIRQNESLLVQGAGGGLGSMLLQLAGLAGVRTLGCDVESKLRQIEADGAIPIDCRSAHLVSTVRDLSGGGVDAVIDVVGGPAQLLRSYRMLKKGGRLLMLGMAGSSQNGARIIVPSLLMMALLAVWPDGRRIATGDGMDTYPQKNPGWYGSTLSRLFRQILECKIDPHLSATVPLAKPAEAHAMLESGNTPGKVVLVSDLDS